jgi:integrase
MHDDLDPGAGQSLDTRTRRRPPRQFGLIRKLPSGRFQASYLGADKQRHTAPATFATPQDADAWLAKQRTALDTGNWRDPKAGQESFAAYATRWISERDLKPRTRGDDQRIPGKHLMPEFGTTPMQAITPTMVRTWYATLDKSTPSMRAHTYSLLRTIMLAAVADDVIAASPCRITGAGVVKRNVNVRPATLAELGVIAERMPARLQMIVLLAAWLGLRFGELAELCRADVDLAHGIVRVHRGVVRVKGGRVVDTPKSAAGVRDVTIPPHLIDSLRRHLLQRVDPGGGALLFPSFTGRAGEHQSPESLYEHYYPARGPN